MMSDGRPRSLARAALGYLVVLVFAAGIGWAMIDQGAEVDAALDQFSVPGLALSFALAVVGVLMIFGSWRAVLIGLQEEIPSWSALRIYALGQVGKYLPGAVWPVLAQARLARSAGGTGWGTGAASALSLMISTGISLVVGATMLELAGGSRELAITCGALGVLILMAVRLYPVAARIIGKRRLNGPTPSLALGPATVSAAWCVAGHLVFGLHLWVLGRALGVHGADEVPLMVAAFALSAGLGVLVVLAPAGMGPREAVLGVVLAPVLGLGDAVLLAGVSRLVLISVDLSLAGAGVAAGWIARDADRPVRTEEC